MNTDELKRELTRRLPKPKLRPRDLLSTGSTLLNYVCTGDVRGGFVKGHYISYVGDSDSGKSWIMRTMLAEAANNPEFDNYRLIYDDVEGKELMDLEHFFGKKLVERMEPPALDDDGNPVCSRTTEEFYFHLHELLSGSRPCIYVLDSQDSLSSDAEVGKFHERKAAKKKGREVAGSYGDGKAKGHSANLRIVLGPLKDTGSILLVVSQTRESFSMFERSAYSGGRALRFYATLQLWSSVKSQISRTYKGRKRQIGVECKVAVKKNHVTGRNRTVIVPILHASGIDYVGSCINWLIEEGVWRKVGQKIEATGLGPMFSGSYESIVSRIEESGLEQDLSLLVGRSWDEIDRNSVLVRKPRYK